MANKSKSVKTRGLLITMAFTLIFGGLAAAARPPQDGDNDEDRNRKVWDIDFLQKRPAGKTSAHKKISYKKVTPAGDASAQVASNIRPDQGSVVGVTIWCLRRSTESDDKKTRILVQEDKSNDAVEWMPERVNLNTLLSEGQHVRLTIESPNQGYLYVIDREKYANNTYSDPYLVFPTTRARGGKNEVSAGRAIELPDQNDKPSYYTLKAEQKEQKYIGDILTILVSPQPIADIKIGEYPIKLSRQQFEQWEKQWSAKTEEFSLDNGENSAYTVEEKSAGSDNSRLLTQDDPLPQTLFHVENKNGDPLLVTVPLQIGAK
jgi:hypothetical protein